MSACDLVNSINVRFAPRVSARGIGLSRASATQGVDEYFLDPKPIPSTSLQVHRDQFTARRSGEIFLCVNDAVIGLPWVHGWFYGAMHHRGKAEVIVAWDTKLPG